MSNELAEQLYQNYNSNKLFKEMQLSQAWANEQYKEQLKGAWGL